MDGHCDLSLDASICESRARGWRRYFGIVKLTRVLFGIADVALAIILLSSVFALIRIFFAFLDLTFPGTTGEGKEIMDGVLALMGLPGMTALSVLLLVLALLFTLAYMLSYYLLLQKQVFGLFLMFGLDLLGLLLWQFDPGIFFFTGVRWLILGSPWLLTYVDLKRRGDLGS